MKRTLVIALVSGLIGFIAGNAFWYLASPLWIDIRVSESAPSASNLTTLKSGSFKDADAVHKGKGTASILEGDGRRYVRFTDFEVTNGPDLEVWLVAKAGIQSSNDVKESKYVSLGHLKGNIGPQNYEIPQDVNLNDYASVVIWCEQFGVLFSAADLK